MAILRAYPEFIDYVEEKGFLPFADSLPGLESLTGLTEENAWHTDTPETDPWAWRIRAVTEKKLAFGCVLGGNKGFVSREWYPVFFAACRPADTLEERYGDGKIAKMPLTVYALFAESEPLSTFTLRTRLHADKKTTAEIDRALIQLQREFLLAVCGQARKRNKLGEEYGWPSNNYCLAEDWAGDWLDGRSLPREEARERILAHCGGDPKKLQKKLFKD